MEAVDPPNQDELFGVEEPRQVRDWDSLVADLMRARSCSKPQAEEFIATNGRVEAEKEIRGYNSRGRFYRR